MSNSAAFASERYLQFRPHIPIFQLLPEFTDMLHVLPANCAACLRPVELCDGFPRDASGFFKANWRCLMLRTNGHFTFYYALEFNIVVALVVLPR